MQFERNGFDFFAINNCFLKRYNKQIWQDTFVLKLMSHKPFHPKVYIFHNFYEKNLKLHVVLSILSLKLQRSLIIQLVITASLLPRGEKHKAVSIH